MIKIVHLYYHQLATGSGGEPWKLRKMGCYMTTPKRTCIRQCLLILVCTVRLSFLVGS